MARQETAEAEASADESSPRPAGSSEVTRSRPLRSIMLMYLFPPHFAGGSLQGSRLMEQLARRGVDVRVLTSMPDGMAAPVREHAFGGRVWRFRLPRRGRTHWLGLRAALWLLIHRDWDVLHVHGYSYFAVLPILVAKLLGRPVIVKTTVLHASGAFLTGSGALSRRFLEAYRKADAIVALSSAIEEDLLERRAVGSRVLRIPNGVDIWTFRPASEVERDEVRRALDVPQDAALLMTCGEVNPRKNLLFLLQALEQVTDVRCVLLVAGPDERFEAYQDTVRSAARDLQPRHQVRFLGHVPPDLVSQLLPACDVFVLPSKAEGMPNALIEALAAGVASVASDIPGCREVLEEGGGVLVGLDDHRDLAAQLSRLLTDGEARRHLAREARTVAQHRFSFESVASAYYTLYEELLGHA